MFKVYIQDPIITETERFGSRCPREESEDEEDGE